MNRRNVLKTGAIGVGALYAQAILIQLASAQQTLPPPSTSGYFKLPPLPYATDALEPFIDARTMELHHDKHHAGYVDKLNAAVKDYPELQKGGVEDLLVNLKSVPEGIRTAVKNQGGGHANHSFWWPRLGKLNAKTPQGSLATDINKQFGSYKGFQDQFTAAATAMFGSGWTWLSLTKDGQLLIESTPNQDSPILAGHTPVLGLDLWEHAYYLKYQNRRAEYVAAFYNVVNWDYVSEKFQGMKAASI
ncbi:MAG: superoxide dismutase [Terriglobia bacterium]